MVDRRVEKASSGKEKRGFQSVPIGSLDIGKLGRQLEAGHPM